MSRTEHIARDAISSLKIVLWNGYIDTVNNGNTYAEVGTGGTMSVTASVEYPAGVFTQILFSASATGSAASASLLVSDAAVVAIPKDAECWIRIFYTNSAGIVYSTQMDASLGDRSEIAVSGLTDKTMSGTVANSNPGFALPPVAIVATTQRASCVLFGDSRVAGSNTADSNPGLGGSLAPSIGKGFGYTNAGVPADSAAHVVASHATRAALLTYYSHVVVALGANDDVSDAGHIQTFKDNLQSLYALAGPTQRVYGVTIDPRATYPGNVRSVDYAAVNTYLRTKPNLFGVFDLASVMDSGSGTWANIAYTSDGIHENTIGCRRIQDSDVVAL